MSTDVPTIDIASRLDAEHRAVFETLPRRRHDWSDISSARATIEKFVERMHQPPLPASVSVEDRYAPGPAGGPDVMLRLYRPASLPRSAPAFYWIHGGGMVKWKRR